MSTPKLPNLDETLQLLQALGRTTQESAEDGSTKVFIDITPESMGIQLAPDQTLGSKLLEQLAGVQTKESKDQSICGWCKKPISGFRDEVSKREYNISSMCQSCQDETFVAPDEEDVVDEDDGLNEA